MPDSIAAIAATIPTSPAMYWPQFSLQPPLPNWVVVAGGASPWYVDALKAGLGSLFGALVAFLFAVWHRQIQERNANLRAGNLALLKLRAIQRITGELRLSVRDQISTQRQIYADAPVWSLMKPMLLGMDEIDAFDLDSLSFLLDTEPGREAVKHVAFAEGLFSTLKVVFQTHQETAIEFQKAGVDLRRMAPNASWNQIAHHVGGELIGRRRSLFWSILQNVEHNPAYVRVCFMKLEAAMKERFGKKVWKLDFDFDPDSARAEPNLPSLPTDIQEELAALPR